MWGGVLLALVPAVPCAERGEIAVRTSDGEPAAGAEVFHLDEAGLAELHRAPIDALETYLERHAERWVADARGLVAAPEPPAGFYYARSGARRGAYRLGPGDEARPLVLAEVPQVAVEVVDAAGAPAAGEAVTFRGYAGALPTYWCGVGVTDAEGRLAFPFFFPLRDLGAAVPPAPFERCTVRLGLLGATHESDVDPLAPGATTLVLERPPVATLELAPAARGGALPDEPFPVSVRPASAGARPDLGTVVALDQGAAQVRVTAGTEIDVTALATPMRARGGPRRVRAPDANGRARVEVERGLLAIDPGEVVVCGRIARPCPQGAGLEPLAGVTGRLLWLPDGATRPEHDAGLQADASGRFNARLRIGAGAPAGALLVLIELDDGDAYEAVVRRPPIDRPIADLGLLALERSPVLAHGRATLPGGEPAAGATIEVALRSGDARSATRRLAALRLFADAQGRFELRGRDRGGDLARDGAFRALSEGYGRTRWAPATPADGVAPELAVWSGIGGSRPVAVDLALDAPAFVVGRLAVADGVDPTRLLVEAVYAGEEETLDPRVAARPGADGRFAIGPLGARPCTLLVALDGSGHAPASTSQDLRMEGVVPAPAADARAALAGPNHPQLDRWDLSEHLFEHELVIVGADGAPIASPRVTFLAADGSAATEGRPRDPALDGDVVRVRGFAYGTRVRIEADGRRARDVALVEPRQRVVLELGIEIALRVVDPPELGDAGFLRARLSAPGERALEVDLARDGARSIRLPRAGLWSLDLQACRVEAGVVTFGAHTDDIRPGWPAAELEVEDRGGQRFDVELDPGLREALVRSARGGGPR